MTDRLRVKWDRLYQSLLDAQTIAMEVLGDEDARDLYVLLGEARDEAEMSAPPGWSVVDRFHLVPMGLGVDDDQ